MKTVILAGGFGTRISEESHTIPKPMIQIGGRPILWHIMKIYSHYGFNDFIILLGYKSYKIVEYFTNYMLHNSDVTLDFRNAADTPEVSIAFHKKVCEPWTISLIHTGLNTQTGSRLLKAREYIGNERFMLTYGDGVGDVNISELVAFHQAHQRSATVTAVQPLGRFGALTLGDRGTVKSFQEKPAGDRGLISAGFFVLEPNVFDYIDPLTDQCTFEANPLENLALGGQLMAFRHTGYWHPLDTMRDKQRLEQDWSHPDCPWRLWSN